MRSFDPLQFMASVCTGRLLFLHPETDFQLHSPNVRRKEVRNRSKTIPPADNPLTLEIFEGGKIMNRKAIVLLILMTFVLFAAATVLADRGKPNFNPAIYADGEVWGTKATTVLPPPNGHNEQSFDALYVIINSNNPSAQLPVGEAAPGNRYYNGGRWATATVMWTQAGFDEHGTVPVLMSYDDVMLHEDLGHLVITDGSFMGGPPAYFQCPLLPVK